MGNIFSICKSGAKEAVRQEAVDADVSPPTNNSAPTSVIPPAQCDNNAIFNKNAGKETLRYLLQEKNKSNSSSEVVATDGDLGHANNSVGKKVQFDLSTEPTASESHDSPQISQENVSAIVQTTSLQYEGSSSTSISQFMTEELHAFAEVEQSIMTQFDKSTANIQDDLNKYGQELHRGLVGLTKRVNKQTEMLAQIRQESVESNKQLKEGNQELGERSQRLAERSKRLNENQKRLDELFKQLQSADQ